MLKVGWKDGRICVFGFGAKKDTGRSSTRQMRRIKRGLWLYEEKECGLDLLAIPWKEMRLPLLPEHIDS